jgi:hypothetical protein
MVVQRILQNATARDRIPQYVPTKHLTFKPIYGGTGTKASTLLELRFVLQEAGPARDCCQMEEIKLKLTTKSLNETHLH